MRDESSADCEAFISGPELQPVGMSSFEDLGLCDRELKCENHFEQILSPGS